MVLHEYRTPKCFPNTSLTIRLSRLQIRTDTSLDRDSRGTPQVRDRSPKNCVHHCRLSWDSTSARSFHQTRTVSTYQDSRGTPRVRVATSTEHFPYNTFPKADQNCAGLMRAERHVTRRDVVNSQTEGNSVSSWKLCTGLTGSATKSWKFISRVKTP